MESIHSTHLPSRGQQHVSSATGSLVDIDDDYDMQYRGMYNVNQASRLKGLAASSSSAAYERSKLPSSTSIKKRRKKRSLLPMPSIRGEEQVNIREVHGGGDPSSTPSPPDSPALRRTVMQLLRHLPDTNDRPWEQRGHHHKTKDKPKRKRPRSAFALSTPLGNTGNEPLSPYSQPLSRLITSKAVGGRSPMNNQSSSKWRSPDRPSRMTQRAPSATITGNEEEDRSHNPGEHKVKQAINAREGYLTRLRNLIAAPGFSLGRCQKDFMELLLLLRNISLEVVEAITNWRRRRQQHAPRTVSHPRTTSSQLTPYMWGDENYLAKMGRDTDFLIQVPYLEDMLNMSLQGNPFIFAILPDGTSAMEARDNVNRRKVDGGEVVVDPLLNLVDSRTSLRIQRANHVVYKEMMRVAKEKGEPPAAAATTTSLPLAAASAPTVSPSALATRQRSSSTTSAKMTSKSPATESDKPGDLLLGNPNYPPRPRAAAAPSLAATSKPELGRCAIMQFFLGQEGDDEDDAFAIAKLLRNVDSTTIGGGRSFTNASRPPAAGDASSQFKGAAPSSSSLRFTPQQIPRSPSKSMSPPLTTPRLVPIDPCVPLVLDQPTTNPSPSLSAIQSLCHEAFDPIHAKTPSNNQEEEGGGGPLLPSSSPLRLPQLPITNGYTGDCLSCNSSGGAVYTFRNGLEIRSNRQFGLPDEPEVFTLSTIHCLLDETLSFIGHLNDDHLRERNRQIWPYFQAWRCNVKFLIIMRRNDKKLRAASQRASFRGWRRVIRSKSKGNALFHMHQNRIKLAVFKWWRRFRRVHSDKKHSFDKWRAHTHRQLAYQRAARYYNWRWSMQLRKALWSWKRQAYIKNAIKLGQSHHHHIMLARTAQMFHSWWLGTLDRSSRRLAQQHFDHRMKRAAANSLELWMRRIYSHIADKMGDRKRAVILRHGAMLFITKLRQRVRWRRNGLRGVIAHHKLQARRAIRTLQRNAKLAAFVTIRAIGSAHSSTLWDRLRLQYCLQRWRKYVHFRTTVYLVVLFWQYYQLRNAFGHWKQICGPGASRLRMFLGKTAERMKRLAGTMGITLRTFGRKHYRRLLTLHLTRRLSGTRSLSLEHGPTNYMAQSSFMKYKRTMRTQRMRILQAKTSVHGWWHTPRDLSSPNSLVVSREGGKQRAGNGHPSPSWQERLDVSIGKSKLLMQLAAEEGNKKSRNQKIAATTWGTGYPFTSTTRGGHTRSSSFEELNEAWMNRASTAMARSLKGSKGATKRQTDGSTPSSPWEVATAKPLRVTSASGLAHNNNSSQCLAQPADPRPCEEPQELLAKADIEPAPDMDMPQAVPTSPGGEKAIEDESMHKTSETSDPSQDYDAAPQATSALRSQPYESLEEMAPQDEELYSVDIRETPRQEEPQLGEGDVAGAWSKENEAHDGNMMMDPVPSWRDSDASHNSFMLSNSLSPGPRSSCSLLEDGNYALAASPDQSETPLWSLSQQEVFYDQDHDSNNNVAAMPDTYPGQGDDGWTAGTVVEAIPSPSAAHAAPSLASDVVSSDPAINCVGSALIGTDQAWAQARLEEDIAAAISIQRVWRGHNVRKAMGVYNEGFRQGMDKLLDEEAPISTTTTEAAWDWKGETEIMAAIDMQRCWRGHRARKNKPSRSHSPKRSPHRQPHAMSGDVAATHIQRSWRGHKGRARYRSIKHQRRGLEACDWEQINAATKIQCSWRGYSVRKSRQALGTREQPKEVHYDESAIVVQKHWRGHQTRKRLRASHLSYDEDEPFQQNPTLDNNSNSSPSWEPRIPSSLPASEGNKTEQLIAAIKLGDLEAARRAIALGAKVNGRNDDGESALQLSLLGLPDHAEEMVKLLVSEGADINGQDNLGRSLIMTCIKFGIDDMIPQLLELKSSISLQDNEGRTALHYAIDEGNMDVLELLLLTAEQEAQLLINVQDNAGDSPLHHAIKMEVKEAVDLLITYGYMDVNLVDDDGMTPLMLAVVKEDYDLIEAILDLGADPTISTSTGFSAFFAAVDREDIRLVDLFTNKASQYLDQQDDKGNTLLHWAVVKHSPQIVSILRSVGASTSVTNYDGYTPLTLASAYGFEEIVELLREDLEKPKKTDTGSASGAGGGALEEEDDGWSRGDDNNNNGSKAPEEASLCVEGPTEDTYLYDF